MDSDNSELMNVNEVARYLKLSVKAIYELTHLEKIPFTKIGRRLRFRRAAIDAWLEKKSPKKEIKTNQRSKENVYSK
ncbi:MAG: helix-turn-helix domain-containing protein [Candidatus Omnitrophica bacterium]|nr:helix-turn-helix domain-containing protein [Candidatus Omnitrophota bacterium]